MNFQNTSYGLNKIGHVLDEIVTKYLSQEGIEASITNSSLLSADRLIFELPKEYHKTFGKLEVFEGRIVSGMRKYLEPKMKIGAIELYRNGEKEATLTSSGLWVYTDEMHKLVKDILDQPKPVTPGETKQAVIPAESVAWNLETIVKEEWRVGNRVYFTRRVRGLPTTYRVETTNDNDHALSNQDGHVEVFSIVARNVIYDWSEKSVDITTSSKNPNYNLHNVFGDVGEGFEGPAFYLDIQKRLVINDPRIQAYLFKKEQP